MGSEYFPDSGRGKVAYMCNLKIAFTENEFQPLEDLFAGATHPDYYRGNKLNNKFFYYGGPHQLNSKGAHRMLDYTILYFTFGLFCSFSFFCFVLYFDNVLIWNGFLTEDNFNFI